MGIKDRKKKQIEKQFPKRSFFFSICMFKVHIHILEFLEERGKSGRAWITGFPVTRCQRHRHRAQCC